MFQIKRTQLLVAAAFAVGSSSVFAVEFSIEGKLTHVYPAGASADAVTSVKCNGSTIMLKDASATDPVKTVYSTPSSTDVPKADFFSTEKFPGFDPTGKPGILDGTCIIDGNTDAAGNLVAEKFFGEPAENVVVGPVTSLPGQRFSIMGVPIVLLTDDTTHMDGSATDPNAGTPDTGKRMKSSPPVNQFGYPVVLSTVPLNDLSAAEGYLAPDGNFYAFALETSEGKSPTSVSLAPTVQRATMEFRTNTSSRLEIRGGCTLEPNANGTIPTSQALRIVVDSTTTTNTATGPVTTTSWLMPNNTSSVDPAPIAPATDITVPTATNATCTADAAAPGSGSYRFRVDNYTYGGSTRRATPVNVKVGVPGKSYSAPVAMERVKFP